MKKESKSQRFFYLSLCLKDNINIIYYNSLGVLSDYKNKWKIVLILGLLAIRIVNLGFNIFDLIFLKPSSPFVPDFLYEELAKPYVVLLAIYLFFLSLVIAFLKKIDSKHMLNEIILLGIILFAVFVDDWVLHTVRTL